MCSPWDTFFPFHGDELLVNTASSHHPNEICSKVCALTAAGLASSTDKAMASPQTSKTSVPTDSASSSDDEDSWPDPFRKVLARPPAMGSLFSEPRGTSFAGGPAWGTSQFETFQHGKLDFCGVDESCRGSARRRPGALADRPEPLDVDAADFVDLSVAEGRRRGQELFAMLLGGTPDSAPPYLADSEAKPDGLGGPNGASPLLPEADAAKQPFEEHAWDKTKGAYSYFATDMADDSICHVADGGCIPVEETVVAAAEAVLGEWYAGMCSTPDGVLLRLSSPEAWRELSPSEAATCAVEAVELATHLLDQKLWSLLGGNKLCRLRRTEGRPQLVMQLPPKGQSLERLCWDFAEKGRCSRRRCSWVHDPASRWVIDLEMCMNTPHSRWEA